ncbi:uncharacterized protein BDFB_013993 [Asbolus verrucosus]|uniref:CHK kinase-like domain-containing protein n=1 Tax=Asbolus verrucosus TaxID=1661398 RepID=A0A482VYN1_ASBVE|nr:uncharacterized protein BDFB_013993 [Asbolus verrucosus]
MDPASSTSEIKSWIKVALANEHLTDFTLNILGNSVKGDGYMGDIVFVNLLGETEDHKSKKYDLVLKCGKKSQALRDSIPVKETYENEIYLYDQVFPAFTQFQLEKGLEKVFDSVPKCYGTYVGPAMEVLVLENLKVRGYELYDRRQPLTIDHINLIVSEYGKWHAISAAMQDQQPEKFKKLLSGIKNLWGKYGDSMDINKMFTSPIDEIYELVKEDIDRSTAEKLKNFKNQIPYIVNELIYKQNYFSVITHGDNWNNNFLFQYENSDKSIPRKVAMLDWQISGFCSPVTDLSYFIYSCVSREDLKKFDDILKVYYESFSNFLWKMGGNPEKMFSYPQLMADWKIFAKFGIMMAFLVVKIAVSDQDEVADIAETIEKGHDVTDTFVYDIKDKLLLKNRLLCIVEHIVERDLI